MDQVLEWENCQDPLEKVGELCQQLQLHSYESDHRFALGLSWRHARFDRSGCLDPIWFDQTNHMTGSVPDSLIQSDGLYQMHDIRVIMNHPWTITNISLFRSLEEDTRIRRELVFSVSDRTVHVQDHFSLQSDIPKIFPPIFVIEFDPAEIIRFKDFPRIQVSSVLSKCVINNVKTNDC